MKKMFTKLFSTGALIGLTLIAFTANAQTTSLTNDNTAPASLNKTTPAFTPAEVKPDAKATAETKAPARAAEDTSWKPQRRVWGYSFGDFYYAGHTDQKIGARGPETNYAGVPTYRNAFQLRRIYL